MTKQRRTFSTEFNREAAGLLLNQGYSYIEASRSLGVIELLCEAFEVPALNQVWWGDITYSSSAGCPYTSETPS